MLGDVALLHPSRFGSNSKRSGSMPLSASTFNSYKCVAHWCSICVVILVNCFNEKQFSRVIFKGGNAIAVTHRHAMDSLIISAQRF